MDAGQSFYHRHQDILGGTPVFVGTRVPIKSLFDYLAARHSLAEFLDHFPTVSRNQAVQILSKACALLEDSAPKTQ